MKILLIEDEILIQKSLKKLLEKKGASVDVASQGREAIELIKNNEYERIICDLMLKDITGFDVIEESKSKYSIDEISKLFVIITAYSSQQVLEKAHKYNCLVINKPFNDIGETINIMLGKNNEK
jgi:CheY-like chemotaxis protein